MRKAVCTAIAVLMIVSMMCLPVSAVDDEMSFAFDLSANGQSTIEVKQGDIITVALKLRRTDASEQYTMYAMQDEIHYDSKFFEYVDNSAMLASGIVSTDIAMVDQYREFYMNYLSMSGGAQWDAETLIGTFQLRVIADSGVTEITNQDYLVSLQDGSDSYSCEANKLTIILSTDCTVRFMTNGGNEISDQIVQYGEKINRPKDPVRDGYTFDGWYKDIHLTEKWDFENDTVQGNMSLYAKWNIENHDVESSAGESNCWLWWLIIVSLILVVVAFTSKKYRDEKRRRKNAAE